MDIANQPQLVCPVCGHNLRGLEPVGPKQVLRCAECGNITSIMRLAEIHLARRRQIHRLMWAVILLLLLMTLVVLLSWPGLWW